MRTAAALITCGALAACSAASAPPPGDEIECALGAGAEFEPVCTVEQASNEGVHLLIVHHPDGGFRRLTVLPDGKGVAAADGAGAPTQKLNGDRLEIAIEGDRYRLPAKPMKVPPSE